MTLKKVMKKIYLIGLNRQLIKATKTRQNEKLEESFANKAVQLQVYNEAEA